MTEDEKEIETIIVGGGQAGISVGRFLVQCKKPFVILEKNSKIGQSWEDKYDSLALDSFAKYSGLKDFPFPGDRIRHPKKEEAASYLRAFAAHFAVYPNFSTEVLKIEKENGKFILTTNRGIFRSKFVVLATGPFAKPIIPDLAKQIVPDIFQIHSQDYRNPQMLPEGNILVVGGGNSGVEIAEELANSGREVFFSFKKKLKSVRSSPFSQWLAYSLGLAHVPKETLLGKLIIWYTKGKAVGVDVKSLLNHPKITQVGECLEIKDGEIICVKANIKNVKNIIWATGYTSDFSAISIPGFDPSTQKRGVTNIPGLYVLNMRWQYSKSSSHLAGVSRDAKYIAKDIMNKL